MNTTALFAELLVIGVQGMVWVSMFIYLFFGKEFLFAAFNYINKDSTLLVGIIFMALTYTLGTAIDRLADTSLKWIDNKYIREKYVNKRLKKQRVNPVPAAILRLTVLMRGGKVADLIKYQRSRIRIARSSVFNFSLITVFLFVIMCLDINFRNVPIGIAIVAGMVLTAVFFYSWRRISIAYYKRIVDAYIIISNQNMEIEANKIDNE